MTGEGACTELSTRAPCDKGPDLQMGPVCQQTQGDSIIQLAYLVIDLALLGVLQAVISLASLLELLGSRLIVLHIHSEYSILTRVLDTPKLELRLSR